MILEIDAGNTRIKWRTLLDGGVRSRGSLASEGIEKWLYSLGQQQLPDKIRLSCVASKIVVEKITQQVEQWGCPLIEAKTSQVVAGVSCGYDDPSALGVDRWLAVVAAYQRFKQPCVVVDAGSAITVDLVDREGRHLGGYIVPGLKMMHQALFNGTSKVKVESMGSSFSLEPGRSTEQAVTQGSLVMVQSMVKSAVNRLRENNKSVQVVVTGGDGRDLMAVLDNLACFDAELVLDGLTFVAP
jgi:type III pantothenate kinase